MMRQLLPVGALFLGLLLSRSGMADDAYDDDATVERPEDSPEHPTGESKPAGDSLESGGLTAPDALPETGDGRTEIEKDLENADQKDAGRGLEFAWVSAEVGFQGIGLSTFKDGGLLPDGASSSGSGVAYGGAVGMRFLYFSLGGRFRNAHLGDLRHWSLLAEGALRVPLGMLEPYASLGGGYAKVTRGALPSEARGFDLRVAVGLDFYPSDSFSIGAQWGGDMLFLSNNEGANIGGGATATGLVGLHF